MSTSEQHLPIWTVYERPADFPNHYIARLWRGLEPTLHLIAHEELERVQAELADMGLTRMDRHSNDDPAVLEVWF